MKDVYDENETGHTCQFNTAGQCECGARVAWPKPSTTVPEPIVLRVDPNPTIVNLGSPVGPGFVVYERAPGIYGYDLKMARGSIGPGWRHLVQVLFDHIEHDKKWSPNSGFANMVVTQVKEKFGALRIYWNLPYEEFAADVPKQPVNPKMLNGAFDQVEGFVDALTAISCKTCEACGKSGSTRGGKRTWLLTLCDDCDKLDRDALRALFEKTEQMEESK